MSGLLPRRSKEEVNWLMDFLGLVVHGINQAGRMDALAAHVKGCKSCEAKLREVVKHAQEEGWQI